MIEHLCDFLKLFFLCYIGLLFSWFILIFIINAFLNWIKRIIIDCLSKAIKNNIENIKMLARLTKLRFLSEMWFRRITPYFPISIKSSFRDQQLLQELKNYENIVKEFTRKIFTINIFGIISFVYSVITIFDIVIDPIILLNLYNSIFTVDTLKLLPLVILVIGIFFSLYFISVRGLVIRSKNGITKNQMESKIMFHEQNRIYLSKIQFYSFENVNKYFHIKKMLLNEVKEYQTTKSNTHINNINNLLKSLDEIEEINNLLQYVNEFQLANKNTFPFIIGINHLSLYKLMSVYGTNLDIVPSKIESFFPSRRYFSQVIANYTDTINRNPGIFNYDNFSRRLDSILIEKIENLIIVETYLEVINKELNRTNKLYKFFGLITNKDKVF